MDDETTVEVGLKLAFERLKLAGIYEDIRMTPKEAAEYWFSCGFKMGYGFAGFVGREKGKVDDM